MPLNEFLKAVQASLIGRAVAESNWMFPTLETLHVFAIAVVVGSILIVDLRLLGLASKSRPVSALSAEFLPMTWAAFALAVISGGLLFAARAADYAAIPTFLAKFAVMGLAGLNMLVFHFGAYRKVERWDLGPTVPAARFAGALSLVFWAGILLLGRKVGFLL